jgi:hypothetical protein
LISLKLIGYRYSFPSFTRTAATMTKTSATIPRTHSRIKPIKIRHSGKQITDRMNSVIWKFRDSFAFSETKEALGSSFFNNQMINGATNQATKVNRWASIASTLSSLVGVNKGYSSGIAV